MSNIRKRFLPVAVGVCDLGRVIDRMIEPERIRAGIRGERGNLRAEYLWRLYQTYSKRNQVLTGPYLDIGCGNLINTSFFRKMTGAEIAVGIDIRRDFIRAEKLSVIRAEASALPFQEGSFELASMISLIEHVPKPFACLSEALRVLRKGGELFVQFPNRYFPMELHSGLFMYFYLPRFLRNWIADQTGRDSMKSLNIPPVTKIRRMLREFETVRDVKVVGISYPQSLVPQSRWILALHYMLEHLGILRVLPMGYVVVVLSLGTGRSKVT